MFHEWGNFYRLRGVALNHRKTMAAKEAFSQRALQKGCMDGSLK